MLFFTALLEEDMFSLATRVATVLLAELLDLLIESVDAELATTAVLRVLEALEDSPKDEDRCAEAD